MANIVRRAGTAVAGRIERGVEAVGEGLRYGVLLVQLGAAALALRHLSDAVRGAYTYVEGCATSVDRLADKAAALAVDDLTTGEHHDAAAVMRSVLEEADALVDAAQDLAIAFEQTRDAHEADYGPVVETANNMPDGIEMAQREFYSNR